MLKWMPWKFFLRRVARAKGFFDPIKLMHQLQSFAQPSEVAAPIELLRLSSVLQVRGMLNAQAIQHNLDWQWPYWIVKQFNPAEPSFIPRAFSMSHINMTHRDWTAIGIPESTELPIVDPRGILTPFYDGWSIDIWVVDTNGKNLIPTKSLSTHQHLEFQDGFSLKTESAENGKSLRTKISAEIIHQQITACLEIEALSEEKASLAISIRPMNPEGVSMIYDIEWKAQENQWLIAKQKTVHLNEKPEKVLFSNYRHGDVFFHLEETPAESNSIHCKIGLATSVALFPLIAAKKKSIQVQIPLEKILREENSASDIWKKEMQNCCHIQTPDHQINYLFNTAAHSLRLHSPGPNVFPGPYTYKHFWFRDAAYILNALLALGFHEKVKEVLDSFPSRQSLRGHFLSQDGEWDSNGEALWIMNQYCLHTNQPPDPNWRKSIEKGAHWFVKKRLPQKGHKFYSGLLPAGFSAEHFGPNDYYYWDDFWAVAGLRSAGKLLQAYGDKKKTMRYQTLAASFEQSIENSLNQILRRKGSLIIPSSPHRRLDSSAIATMVAGYPLQILQAKDPRVMATVDYLLENCMIDNGFFHDMSHSGINIYLTLQIAQVLLRAGDSRYWLLIKQVAALASETGQWAEAIHPHTKGGCMGDGQHLWASAEWILMIRNCFVREEGNQLVLGSGIPKEWLQQNEVITFGPVSTKFGEINITIQPHPEKPILNWEAKWHQKEPEIINALELPK